MFTKNKNMILLIFLAIAVSLFYGCHRTVQQSKIVPNTQILSIYVDDGTSTSFTEKQIKGRNEIKNYFEIYMAKKAQKLKYSYRILDNPKQWLPQKDNYFLCIYLGEYTYGAPRGSAFLGNIFKAGITGGYEIHNGTNEIILHGQFDKKKPGWKKTVERIGTDIAVEFRNYMREH